MASPQSLRVHVVFVGWEAWSHMRPQCNFASRLVLTREVNVTFFTSSNMLDRVKSEISRSFRPEDSKRLDLIRVIALSSGTPAADSEDNIHAQQERFKASFLEAYARLIDEEPVACSATNVKFLAVPAPKVILIDLSGISILKAIRAFGKSKDVKAFTFCSGSITFMHLLCAPVKLGGIGSLSPHIEQESAKTGRPVAEVADRVVATHFTDKVHDTPGLPSMYHWEHGPQDSVHILSGVGGFLWLSMQEVFAVSDGVILNSPEVYEPEAIAAIREWFAETSRTVFAMGPMLPFTASTHEIAGEGTLSGVVANIKKFMDAALQSHGEKSMIYISFGSVFWPSNPKILEAFIDVIIERKIPFILSHRSPFASLPDRLREKIEAFGIGLLSPWSPQQTILTHPALGWFVSHCGHNSVIEAVTAGVPLICWPFHGDQPSNAAILVENHDVAYELIEVRTGNGLKPRYRTGKAPVGTLDSVRAEAHDVLGKAFGSDGARKRENAVRLKEAVLAAWDEGGSSEKEVGRFLDLLHLDA